MQRFKQWWWGGATGGGAPIVDTALRDALLALALLLAAMTCCSWLWS